MKCKTNQNCYSSWVPTGLAWGSEESARKTCERTRRLVALAGLILMGVTWRLWFEPLSFPRVPLVSWGRRVPVWCDLAGAGVMTASLLALLFLSHRRPVADMMSWLFCGAFAAVMLLDQHRLQPWAFEFFIMLLVMAILPTARAVPCLRLVVASIYLHSGLSKLDASFLTTHGETFVAVLTESLGWDFAEWPASARRLCVAALPLGEIAVAAGFCFRRTQKPAVWASFLMHASLLWILGPFGLGHQPGVLIWNVYFIVQNVLLFRPFAKVSDVQSQESSEIAGAGWRAWCGYGFVAAVVMLPFLEPFSLYDHWPAWAVYASRPERTRVYIAGNRVPNLSPELQRFVGEKQSDKDAMARWLAGKSAWREVRIDRWSLEALGAPIYPQDRYQVGVALAIAEKCQLGQDIRVEIDSPANRWTGQRSTEVYQGTGAIRELARQYRLNAFPSHLSGTP